MNYLLLLAQEVVSPINNWDITKVIIPIISAIAGGVGMVWKFIDTSIKKADLREACLTSELKECNTLHRERDTVNNQMYEKIGKLEGMMCGHEQAREDLKELSDTVVEMIHKSY